MAAERPAGPAPTIKISLVVQVKSISKTAADKIIKAGGKIEAVVEKKKSEET